MERRKINHLHSSQSFHMRKENKENGESSRHAEYKQYESSQSHPGQLYLALSKPKKPKM